MEGDNPSANQENSDDKFVAMDSEEIDFGSEPFSGHAADEASGSAVQETPQALEVPETDCSEVPSEDAADTIEGAVDGSEEQIDHDLALAEVLAEDESEFMLDSEEVDSEAVQPEESSESAGATKSTDTRKAEPRLVQFPLSKVKQIIKLDTDVHIISSEAIFLITRAAELFAQNLAKESYSYTTAGKKKTISKRDVEQTIESVGTLSFLEGMMNV